jgi:hypothetical protein
LPASPLPLRSLRCWVGRCSRACAFYRMKRPCRTVTVQQIGVALVGRYVLPLEIVAVLLTAALIGAVIVAMHEKVGHEKEESK